MLSRSFLKALLVVLLSIFASAQVVVGGKSVAGGKSVVGGTGAAGGGGTVPTVHSTCKSHVAFGDITCVFSPNISGGGALYVAAQISTGTAFTISGCGATWTTDTLVVGSFQSTGAGASAGACTVTIHITAGGDSTKDVAALEVQGTSGVDVRSAIVDQAFIATPSNISCPSVTTTVDHDLVVCTVVDYNGGGTTFTAGSPGVIAVQTSNAAAENISIQTQEKTPAGAVAPFQTYDGSSSFASMQVAFKP